MTRALNALPTDTQEARKARGAFFTPQPMATFLVQWALRSPTDTIFEPSCGEAAFLIEAVSRLRPSALHASHLNRSRARTSMLPRSKPLGPF